jgi:tetratricopeptide (TPR) repeat protein
MPDAELFYAGYWLAKTGHYAEALAYLELTRRKDERVLTYIGFATRKLGDVEAALPLYTRALEINPDYVVARAYLGDAYLTKGEPAKAKAELLEIERRCGKTCAPYADLASHIASYEAGAVKG